VAAREIHDDGHDRTESQVALAGAALLAVLEQTVHIQGFKPLAKIINIAEHGDQLAHGDLRMMAAKSWQISLTYVGSYGLASFLPYPELRLLYTAMVVWSCFCSGGCP
jgi:hypothetical protein